MIKKEKGEESGLAGRVKGASPRYTVSTFSPTPRILSVYLFFPLPSPSPLRDWGPTMARIRAWRKRRYNFRAWKDFVLAPGSPVRPAHYPLAKANVCSPALSTASCSARFRLLRNVPPDPRLLACLDLVKLNYRRLSLDKYAKGGRKEGKNKRNTFNFRDVKTTKIGSKESWRLLWRKMFGKESRIK